MPATVLIAASEHLAALKAHAGLDQAITFSEGEALRALDAITRQRPPVVALEQMFAKSSRGAALINRIKADPSLAGCEIRIVTRGGDAAATVTPAPTPQGDGNGGLATAVAAPPAAAKPAALDQRGTRRAPRFRLVEGIEVFIDGNPATLIDLSTVGAQVVSSSSLRPNQRLRLSLPAAGGPLRFSGAVAWASFEMPKGGPRYRAGIEFFDANADAVAQFCAENKAVG